MADDTVPEVPTEEQRLILMLSTLLGPSHIISPCELHTVAVPIGFLAGARSALQAYNEKRAQPVD